MLATAPATAMVPPVAATHGPHEAAWNVGGKAIASADARAIAIPPTIMRIAPARAGWVRNHHATGRRAVAATAATIDHRTLGTHAPRNRSPAPVRVHGPAVASKARRAPAKATQDPVTGRSGSGGVEIPGSPSSSARHSGPRTRPRTGTAHARHTGSSQALHRAIAVLLGWWRHRSWTVASAPSDPGRVGGSAPGSGAMEASSSTRWGTPGARSSAFTRIAYGLRGRALW